MNDLEFTFGQSPLEQLLQGKKPGDVVSAAKLLSLTEEADDMDTLLESMNEQGITLDITALPKITPGGASADRLIREEQLVNQGQLFQGIDKTDPLLIYLRELEAMAAQGDTARLSQRLIAGDADAMQLLADILLPRAVELAQAYVGRGVLLMDLIQEANLGLWQGLQYYTQGDVTAHCDWWMRQYLAAAVTLQAMDSGLGQKLRQAAEDYRSVDEKLLTELGRNPTLEEMAEGLHMTPEETEVVAEMLTSARTLQHARQPEPEQLPQEEDQAVEDTAYFQMRQRITELLSDLPETDRQLLSLRYGLEGGLPMDARQVADRMGLTLQQVTEREAAALMKLRHEN